MDPHVPAIGNDNDDGMDMDASASRTEMRFSGDAEVGGDGNITNRTFTADVPADVKPRIGMEFSTLDDAYNFYNNYACHSGFSVRKDTTNKTKSGVICMRILRCSKAGLRIERNMTLEKKKRKAPSITRCSCPARIYVRLDVQKEVYCISQFIEEHNHALCTPKKTRRLRSHKQVNDEELNMLVEMKSAGIGIARSLDFLRDTVGGPSQLPFTDRDARNALKKRRQMLYSTNANTLVHSFVMKSREDPGFTYDVRIDDEGRLTSCFWVDGKSVADYSAYSDVICFDTTYRTNEYDMPFGPFVGVNHHMQTTLFGAGLLFGETVDDFKWLFETWLHAMGGVHPKTIITDQDNAITAAIAVVFPNTKHLLCLWHIMKKLPEKLSHVIHENPAFKATWNNCIFNTDNTEECDRCWELMVEEYKLQDNRWLQHMFAIRHMWIPTYTKSIFSAGMRTTGRSESINAFFDGFVNYKSSLIDFANGYEKALQRRREAETDANFKIFYGKPILKTKFELK